MRYYETLYLINPELAEEDCRGVIDKFNSLIEKNNGVVIKVDEWGKKTLAYQIKKFDKGYYVLLQYCGEPGLLTELRDNADPEALKPKTEPSEAEAEAEAGEAETGDEAKPTEEVSHDQDSEKVKDQEGKNGIQ
jgi:small subunit ribosomal protein S6